MRLHSRTFAKIITPNPPKVALLRPSLGQPASPLMPAKYIERPRQVYREGGEVLHESYRGRAPPPPMSAERSGQVYREGEEAVQSYHGPTFTRGSYHGPSAPLPASDEFLERPRETVRAGPSVTDEYQYSDGQYDHK